MPKTGAAYVASFDPQHGPQKGSVFRGLSLAFLGFDAESLDMAAAAAADAAATATSNHDAAIYKGSACGDAWRSAPYKGAHADATSARVLLQEMKEKATAEGARVVAASREGIVSAGFLVCNFAAAFFYLRRLVKQQQHLAPREHDEPHQLVATLGLEPLRLLTPFWLFACLRDRRVYAPDAHSLFRVSAALTHTKPPLLSLQQPLLENNKRRQPAAHKQLVLLLGCTRRLRRVRRTRDFGRRPFASDSESSDKPPASGHALAVHDEEIVAACIEALGGRCVTTRELGAAADVATTQNTTAGTLPLQNNLENSGVGVVLVGHLPSLLRRSAALHADDGTQHAGAAAELSLLRRLQEHGVACLRLQWLLDAYRFGRAPPYEMYAVHPPPSQRNQHLPAIPTTVALRRKVLEGVQVLVSDVTVTRDPVLLQRVVGLGCTDVAAIPSFLGVYPWLFRCSTTKQLAAVICGSHERMQVVNAALQRAACRRQACAEPPLVLLVLQREEVAGLLDLAAVVAEMVGATACSQQSVPRKTAPSGRPASIRHNPSHQPPSSQQQQHIRGLVAAAQQRVLQHLSPAAALETQKRWDSAAEAAVSSATPAEDSADFITQCNATAATGARTLVVSPEWIVRCWEEARRLPVDSVHGRIEVPDFWTDGALSDSTGHWEDVALTAALKDSGGAVVYGDLPVVADAKETRLRRALGALEHALLVSLNIQQHYPVDKEAQRELCLP